MKLDKLIEQALELQKDGYGDLEVEALLGNVDYLSTVTSLDKYETTREPLVDKIIIEIS